MKLTADEGLYPQAGLVQPVLPLPYYLLFTVGAHGGVLGEALLFYWVMAVPSRSSLAL